MLALLALLAGAPPAPLESRLEAALSKSAPYAVEVHYRLAADRESAARLPFTILEARGARVEDLTADGVRVDLDRSRAPLLRGEAAVSAAGTVSFRYLVSGTTLPVVVPEALPGDAVPGTFRAALRLPEGLHLVEGFPSGISDDGDGRLVLDLPIVPAFVSVRLTEAPPLLTFPRVLDGLVVILLLGLGALVLRRR